MAGARIHAVSSASMVSSPSTGVSLSRVAGESEMRSRRNQRIDLRRREMIEEVRHEVVDAVARQSFVGEQRLKSVRQLMSTVALMRSSSAASHHAIVLPIDMPSVAMRCAVDVIARQKKVDGAQAVVDHHSPQHLPAATASP